MKRLKRVLINLSFVVVSLSFINVSPPKTKEFETFGVLLIEPQPKNDLKKYLYDLGARESKNNYQIVNRWGYMGRYQFGMSTLKSIGFNVTKEEFLQDALLQDMAMIELLRKNRVTLSEHIHKYDSTTVGSNIITESGILAGAHLGGAGNVKKYLYNNRKYNKRDKMGTSIGNYTQQFSGYELNLDE